MRRIVAVLALLAGLMPAAAAADHWSPLRWAEPVVTFEDRTGVDYLREATREAVQAWNAGGAGIKLAYREAERAEPGACAPQANVVPFCRSVFTGDRAGYVGWAGLAWYGDGRIAGAVLEYNEAVYGDEPRDDAFATAAHEIGHGLALGHSADPGSVMGGAAAPGPHDFETLLEMYPPDPPVTTTVPTTSSTSTTSTVPPTTVPPTTSTTAPPPPTSSTSTIPPAPATTVPSTSVPPAPATYCDQLRVARAQVDAALSRPGLERYRAAALRQFDAALRGCA